MSVTTNTTSFESTLKVTCSTPSNAVVILGWLGSNRPSISQADKYNTTTKVIYTTLKSFAIPLNSDPASATYTYTIGANSLRNAGETYTTVAFCVQNTLDANNKTVSVFSSNGWTNWTQPDNKGKSYVVYVSYNTTTANVPNVSLIQYAQAQGVFNALKANNAGFSNSVVDGAGNAAKLMVRMLDNSTNSTNTTNNTNNTNTTNGTTNGTNGTTNGTNGTTNGTNGTNGTTVVNFTTTTVATYILRDYSAVSDTTGAIVSAVIANTTNLTALVNASVSAVWANFTGITFGFITVNTPAITLGKTSSTTTTVTINVGSNVNGTVYVKGTADQAYNGTYLSNTDVLATVDQNNNTWPYKNQSAVVAGGNVDVTLTGLPSNSKTFWYIVVQDNLPTPTLSAITATTVSTTGSGSFGEKAIFGFGMILAIFLAVILN